MAKTFDDLLRSSTLEGLLTRLSTRLLLLVVGGLFVADLMVPDPIPFIDEIVLGGLTLLLARWSSRRPDPASPRPAESHAKPPPKNVTPPA